MCFDYIAYIMFKLVLIGTQICKLKKYVATHFLN